MYTITYKVESYFQFQWKVCQLFGSYPNTGTLLNEKVARLSSGDLLWSVNTIHFQMINS